MSKHIIPCDIYQVDDSIMRGEGGEGGPKASRMRCGKCRYWLWKVGDMGVCMLKNTIETATGLCDSFREG